MTKKLYIETVGCQMNVLDSELVLGQLRAMGYALTEDYRAADVPMLPVVTSYVFTAKRMLQALHMSVQRHEQAFGVLETDVQKRVVGNRGGGRPAAG